MCLIIKRDTLKKTAEEDITVYKVMRQLYAIVQSYTYVIGVVHTTELGISRDFLAADSYAVHMLADLYGDDWRHNPKEELIAIGPGFHSCKTEERARNLNSGWSCDIWECTIPKGSSYYEDETGLLASNRIIINKMV